MFTSPRKGSVGSSNTLAEDNEELEVLTDSEEDNVTDTDDELLEPSNSTSPPRRSASPPSRSTEIALGNTPLPATTIWSGRRRSFDTSSSKLSTSLSLLRLTPTTTVSSTTTTTASPTTTTLTTIPPPTGNFILNIRVVEGRGLQSGKQKEKDKRSGGAYVKLCIRTLLQRDEEIEKDEEDIVVSKNGTLRPIKKKGKTYSNKKYDKKRNKKYKKRKNLFRKVKIK